MARDKNKDVARAPVNMYLRKKRRSKRDYCDRLLGIILMFLAFLLAAFLLAMAIWLPYTYGSPIRQNEQSVSAYVGWFLRHHPKRWARVKAEVLPIVIQESNRYNVDPLLVSCIISLESSWRPRKGAVGERGYMQVLPARWTRDFDLNTPAGQIRAGVYRLRLAFIACDKLEPALTHYACGSCKSKSERTQKKMKYRINYYNRMVKKFGSISAEK